MNITKMFEHRKEYDERWNRGSRVKTCSPDKIANLIESVGKLLGAWRGHHYWSEKREPDGALIDCKVCQGRGFWFDGQRVKCKPCNKTGKVFSPLLEAYVEGLGWVLSVGNDLVLSKKMAREHKNDQERWWLLAGSESDELLKQYIWVSARATDFWGYPTDDNYYLLFTAYLHLGKLFGFTDDQIETAYTAHINALSAKDGVSA